MEYLRDEVDRALDAVDAKDYAAAVAILEPLVERGNAKACLNMAFLYSLGWGVQLDALKAAEMYEPAGGWGLEINSFPRSRTRICQYSHYGTSGIPAGPGKAAKYSRWRSWDCRGIDLAEALTQTTNVKQTN